MDLTVVSRDELPPPEGDDAVSRQLVFDAATTMVVRSRVGAGATTGWHHNGDRHVYGHVVAGMATMEYGPAGDITADLGAGDFIYVPPGTIRRVVNDAEEDWVIVISFVGTGPPAVSVDGPAPPTE